MDNIDDKERTPAEKKDSHYDANRNSCLVLLHKTVRQLFRSNAWLPCEESLTCSSMPFPSSLATNRALDSGQKSAALKTQLNISSKQGRRLDVVHMISPDGPQLNVDGQHEHARAQERDARGAHAVEEARPWGCAGPA